MAGGDRTGPVRMGPMTGRAAGYCAGYPIPGFMNRVPGSGFWGWGRGVGRGQRNWFHAAGLTGWQRAAPGLSTFGASGAYAAPFVWPFVPATISTEQELDLLERQAEYFTNPLEGIRKPIEELEAQPQEKQGRVAATTGTVRIAAPFRPGQSAAKE